MITLIAAVALSAAAPTQAAPASPHVQHTAPAGQMDHSKMGQKDGSCCNKSADGKMECQLMKDRGSQGGARDQHQGHSEK
jgi:hypothetical protein